MPFDAHTIQAGAEKLLLKHGKQNIWEHSQQVAKAGVELAGRFRLDPDICAVSAYCHDIAGIFTGEEMLERARREQMELDPAEIKYPFLLHQRFSAIMAQSDLGVTDERVLSAVACHTTLKAEASPYDMALFLADKLAWDQGGQPPFYDIIMEALPVSLEHASLSYLDYALSHGMILIPHHWLQEAHNWLKALQHI